MGTTDLLPCPFCGGKASVSQYQTESLWSHDQVTYTQVGCGECDYHIATEPGYEMEAPVRWNARTTPGLPERGGWRDIASAPKDGARFLGCQDGLQPEVLFWSRQVGWATDGLSYRDPTHWQPLPSAPEGPAPHGELEEMRDTLGRVYALLSGDPNTEFGTVPTACVALIERFLSSHPGATTKGVSEA